MAELNNTHIAGLVLRAKANDSDAFAEIYALTYNRVYNYARHYLRDDHLAQDALQEIYILALKNLNKLHDPLLFIAWLNRISFNVCFDISQKEKKNFAGYADSDLLSLIENEHPDSNPESRYQRSEQTMLLHDALEQLPFLEKQIIVMRYFNSMKLEEIALALSISLSTTKRHLNSGLKKLRTLMKG